MKTTPQYIRKEYCRRENIKKLNYYRTFIKYFRNYSYQFADGTSYTLLYDLKELLEKRGWEVKQILGLLYIRPKYENTK